MAQDVNITYETLFDILRIEKNKEELQKLPENFFSEVIFYLQEKQSIVDQEGTDLFSFEEKENFRKQLDNAKRIFKEIYERREKKIINTAINKSRTNSAIIDVSAMMGPEIELYNDIVRILNKGRIEILNNVLRLHTPVMLHDLKVKEENNQKEKELDILNKDSLTIRFLCRVQQFVGKDLEPYGPYEEDDIASLPREIADVLITNQRAEEIRDSY